jgi:hypothetical protein
MAVSLTHTTAATGVDSGDGKISKNAWNEAHTLTAADGKLLGASGSTTVGEITVGTGLSLSAGSLTNTVTATAPAGSSGQLQYNNSSAFGAASLWQETANLVAQRNGTTAQALRVYNTYTDASNYEYGGFEWASNVLKIGTQKAGTGATRAIDFYIGGSALAGLDTSGNFTIPSGGWQAPSLRFSSGGSNAGISYFGGVNIIGSGNSLLNLSAPAIGMPVGIPLGWSNNGDNTSDNLFIRLSGSPTAGALDIHNKTTNAAQVRIYETLAYTSNYASARLNYSNIAIAASSTAHQIKAEAGGTGTKRVIAIDAFDKAGAPAASDLPSGSWGLINDTSGGVAYLCLNRGGTLVKVALA